MPTHTHPMQPKIKEATKLSPCSLLGEMAIAAPLGALGGLIGGSIGKWGMSFFNPSAAALAGSIGTFALMGAIAAPLTVIPHKITSHFLNNNEFLKTHPNLKGFLKDTATFLYYLGAVAAAAAMLSIPVFGPTVLAMMIIPAAFYAIKTLCAVINGIINCCNSNKNELAAQQPAYSM